MTVLQTVIRKYLYGMDGVPENLVDDGLIRNNPLAPPPSTALDVNDFMTTGGGRFAIGSQFELINEFFDAGNSIPAGTYTKADMAAYLDILPYYGWSMQQYDWQDGTDDYAERAFIFNSMAFKIVDGATFVVDSGGARPISNYAIVPDVGDVPENFDFVTDDQLSAIANEFFERFFDPSGIGRRVDIDFIATRTTSTYTSTEYAADQTLMSGWSGLDATKLVTDLADIFDGLWDDGIIKFLDEADRPIVYGTDGADSLSADLSSVTYPYLSSYETNGAVLIGGSGDDVLEGNDYNDYLVGGDDEDVLTGGDGNDVIDGGADADDMDGGDGTDTLSYAGSSAGVTVNLSTGGASGGDAAGDTFANFENLIGSAAADSLTGSNAANTIRGGDGADTLYGLYGDDLLVGGEGGDTLRPGFDDDIIVLGDLDPAHLGDAEAYGDADSDQNTVYWASGVGSDVVVGFKDAGAANADVLSVDGLGAADIRVLIDEANDRISFINRADAANSVTFVEANGSYDFTAGGTKHLSFTSSNVQFSDGSKLFLQDSTLENITGTAQADYLIGSIAGDDTFIDSQGADWFDGLGGTNTVSYAGAGAAVNVTLDAGATALDALGVTTDKGTAVVGKATDTLLHIQNVTGTNYGDTINGTSGANTLDGGQGNDSIYGWNGDDTISGGAGADALCGDEGADTLAGGTGADVFQYFGFYAGGVDPGGQDTGVGPGNRDIITDFSQAQGDRIGFYTDYAGMKFIGTKSFSGTARQINYASSGGVTIVGGDIDADGTLDFQIELAGTFTLTASDFILT